MEVPKGNVIVEFYSPKCKSCGVVERFLEDILKKFRDVKLVKVNVLERRDFARKFGVIALPVLVALKDGIEVSRLKGAKNRSEIETFLMKAFR